MNQIKDNKDKYHNDYYGEKDMSNVKTPFYPQNSTDSKTGVNKKDIFDRKTVINKNHRFSYSQISQRRYYNDDKSKSKIQSRIQKACPLNNSTFLKKEMLLLRKQIQRLQKENLKKDNKILEIQSAFSLSKQIQVELSETYRMLFLYEGKIQQLERDTQKLQKIFMNSYEKTQQVITVEEIQALLNQYRDENIIKSQIIEEQKKIILDLQDSLRSTQSKYFQTAWKLSKQVQISSNPLNANDKLNNKLNSLSNKYPKLRNLIVVQDLDYLEKQTKTNGTEKKKEKETLKSNVKKQQSKQISLRERQMQLQKKQWQNKNDREKEQEVRIKNEEVKTNEKKSTFIKQSRKIFSTENILDTPKRIVNSYKLSSNVKVYEPMIKPLLTYTIPENEYQNSITNNQSNIMSHINLNGSIVAYTVNNNPSRTSIQEQKYYEIARQEVQQPKRYSFSTLHSPPSLKYISS